MTQQPFGESYGRTAPENYERFFVPAIGAPLAADLVDVADLRPGERVLDVACGTGVVTRLAAPRVGEDGAVAGLDMNAAMLAVARAATASHAGVDWHEASAEAMPLDDGTFDVVLCQMGLQFMPDKVGALREMRRVLAPDGRAVLNVPGPTPPVFAEMADALTQHVGPHAAAFVHAVFSLHDERELRDLMGAAGFLEVEVRRLPRTLTLPPGAAFLWQYLSSTPLAALVAETSDERRTALEAEVVDRWRPFGDDEALTCDLTVSTVLGRPRRSIHQA